MKTKKELLKEVERRELERVDSLGRADLLNEVAGMLMLDDEEFREYEKRSGISLINAYMDAYMSFKADYSEEELKELLTN